MIIQVLKKLLGRKGPSKRYELVQLTQCCDEPVDFDWWLIDTCPHCGKRDPFRLAVPIYDKRIEIQ